MVIRILFFTAILLTLASCHREKVVVESAYPDGSPQRVCVYRGSGDNKELVKETMYYPGKKIRFTGGYNHDKRDGKWVYYYPNGNIWSEGFFKDGKNDGKRTVCFENGKIKYEACYRLGARTGKWRFYDEKGDLIKEIDYSSK